MITQKELKNLMTLDQETGEFTWLKRMGGTATTGSAVGSYDAKGYKTTSIYGKHYKIHRLIWLYIFGIWPAGVLDHIDGNKSNNCLSNLRDTNQMINGTNRTKLNKNNTSGYMGVYRDKKKWNAEIIYLGEKFRLGSYNTPEEANEALIAFREEFGI